MKWKAPVAIWVAMSVLVAALVWVGAATRGDARYLLAMAGSAGLLALLAFGLVGVARLGPLERLVAGAGWLFITLLAMLSFADILTRAG